ncbi:hypothetical protein CEXT_595741 [Caerostris extrusa]|uniref:Uncharacterized protein n=1 Tax=Caerostris extrusa TaxID=172846 RepID=A0AAV4Y1F1_CAEEX|nr:hypothetical protein CEXT_595741 [Caerostris extrusa]
MFAHVHQNLRENASFRVPMKDKCARSPRITDLEERLLYAMQTAIPAPVKVCLIDSSHVLFYLLLKPPLHVKESSILTTHMWAVDNPHETRPSATQHSFAVNVRVEIVASCLVGPYILPPRMNAYTYLIFLEFSSGIGDLYS